MMPKIFKLFHGNAACGVCMTVDQRFGKILDLGQKNPGGILDKWGDVRAFVMFIIISGR
jgi:hypothetical protein